MTRLQKVEAIAKFIAGTFADDSDGILFKVQDHFKSHIETEDGYKDYTDEDIIDSAKGYVAEMDVDSLYQRLPDSWKN